MMPVFRRKRGLLSRGLFVADKVRPLKKRLLRFHRPHLEPFFWMWVCVNNTSLIQSASYRLHSVMCTLAHLVKCAASAAKCVVCASGVLSSFDPLAGYSAKKEKKKESVGVATLLKTFEDKTWLEFISTTILLLAVQRRCGLPCGGCVLSQCCNQARISYSRFAQDGKAFSFIVCWRFCMTE